MIQDSGSPDYCFKSSSFEIEPGEDEAINPRIYGRQLARWLRQRLLGKGYPVVDVRDEDWGRALVCSREPFLLFVACGNVWDPDTTRPGDGPPAKEDVIWQCSVMADVSFWTRRIRKIDAGPALARLHQHLGEILRAEPTITLVPEP